MEISLRSFFRDFNASRFVLYNCLMCFCTVFALRLDGTIQLNYALVFLPLWICESVVFVGALVAIISFIISPPSSSEIVLRSDFYGLILSTGEHALLLMFEALVCYKLEFDLSIDELPWLLVFAPLFALSLLSIVVAIWAIRHDKSFEFELFFSISVVQFVFLAFKLDATLDWHWSIVFIPLWVVLSLCVVGVLYALVLAVVLARSVHMLASQRRHHLYSALCHTLLVIPILIFLLLLTGKLDAITWSEDDAAITADIPYIVVCTPLIISLICLVLMSFGARGGNQWWFGMRAPFCSFLLETCPCLKQYANLSYKFGASSPRNSVVGSTDAERQSLRSDPSSRIPLRPVVPIRSIESPD